MHTTSFTPGFMILSSEHCSRFQVATRTTRRFLCRNLKGSKREGRFGASRSGPHNWSIFSKEAVAEWHRSSPPCRWGMDGKTALESPSPPMVFPFCTGTGSGPGVVAGEVGELGEVREEGTSEDESKQR